MADTVYRCNPNAPVRQGGAVVGPSGPGEAYHSDKHGSYADVADMADQIRYNDFGDDRSRLASTGDYVTGNPNSATTLTFPANFRYSHVVGGVHWSYDSDPTATGTLQIYDSGNVVFNSFVTDKGPGFFPFDPPKRGTQGNPMQIILSAGGTNVKGTVGALSHWTE